MVAGAWAWRRAKTAALAAALGLQFICIPYFVHSWKGEELAGAADHYPESATRCSCAKAVNYTQR